MEYGIFDALRHGIGRVIVAVSKTGKDAAKELLEQAGRKVPIDFLIQDSADAPRGMKIPDALAASPGTAHAIFCARHRIDGPFAVINGDDFYAPAAWDAMAKIADWNGSNRAAIVAYQLASTLSPNGAVSRGICHIEDDKLISLKEMTGIIAANGKILSETGDVLPPDTPVSMNFFSFPKNFVELLAEDGEKFFQSQRSGEWALPDAISRMLGEKLFSMAAASSNAPWFGVTHRTDRATVEIALAEAISKGLYAENLW
jgi:NDP-sugar pyrophosphorylase family protein